MLRILHYLSQQEENNNHEETKEPPTRRKSQDLVHLLFGFFFLVFLLGFSSWFFFLGFRVHLLFGFFFLAWTYPTEIAELMYKSLKGRKYLIVLDDIWSTKVWDDVRRMFPDDCNGSRIMFTTRLSDVAAYTDSCSPIHEMHFLDKDLLDLLCERVFGRETINCTPELERIGRMIAQRCRGLPLAIVVIGGILSTLDLSRPSWESIAKSVDRGHVANKDEQFEKIFSLSYSHLPHHLRSCFLYVGCFPEDEEIRVRKLIKLWVAEGFLKASGSKSLEESAEEYLEDLVKRSLILVSKRTSTGKIKSCAIHDVLWDMCLRKAQLEKFLLPAADDYFHDILPEAIKNHWRIGLFPSQGEVLKDIHSTNLRTILYFKPDARLPRRWSKVRSVRVHITMPSAQVISYYLFAERLLSCFEGLRFLRVLEALEIRFDAFPLRVLGLVLLRYLALTLEWCSSSSLPCTIIKLHKLQTLILRPFTKSSQSAVLLLDLPIWIWKMPQLRHIDVGPASIPPVPAAIFRSCVLQNLQTLSVLSRFKWTKEYCEIFPNLRKLAVTLFVDEEAGEGVDGISSLVYLPSLQNLKLGSRCPCSFSQGFAFPATLKKLTLKDVVIAPYLGIIGSLPNLEVLKLKNYELPQQADSKTWETSEGQFPCLKSLMIEKTNLELWITESSHFPSLKRIRLYGCRGLREIPQDIGEISALELIEVDDSNTSIVGSAKRIQQEQQDLGNELEVTVKVCSSTDNWEINIRMTTEFRDHHAEHHVERSSNI